MNRITSEYSLKHKDYRLYSREYTLSVWECCSLSYTLLRERGLGASTVAC